MLMVGLLHFWIRIVGQQIYSTIWH